MMEGDVEVFDNPFDEPPEARAEDALNPTIYVRVPPSLKRRVEQAAETEKLSANSFVIRCLESCLGKNTNVQPLKDRQVTIP